MRSLRRSLALVGLGVAALALPGGPAAAAEPAGLPAVLDAPADGVRDEPAWRDVLLRLFLDGVMRDERRVDGNLAKWTGPVELTLAGAAAAPYVAFVEELAADLARLTGLAISVSADGRRAGAMDVHIASDPRYWPSGLRPADGRTAVFTCAAAPRVRGGVISRASIRINAGVLDPASVRACLVEEIVQSLGLFGEVSGRDDTILGDRVGHQHLGIVDRLLLRTLYDPRLPPGVSRAAASATAALVLGEQLARVACRKDATALRRCELALPPP
jgi:Protein of unknown function (DUF2927)